METFHYKDVVFAGGTLWTNLNRRDPLTAIHLRNNMSDYNIIRNKPVYRKLTPEDTIQTHDATVQYLKVIASEHLDKKMVVVTHHAPSYESISPRYRGDFLMNGGYASDLSDFILDNSNIKLWVHGHTHDDYDYNVGNTRIICNPRGYLKYEPRVCTFDIKTVEI